MKPFRKKEGYKELVAGLVAGVGAKSYSIEKRDCSY